MNTAPLTLKTPRGWFAAGVEVDRALTLLSDGAFKLFLYVCLNARRDTGVLAITQTDLALSLNKARKTIRDYVNEMENAGICRSHYGRNPNVRGTIEIVDSYWPYQKTVEPLLDDAAAAFVSEIRKLLQARACVQSSFSTADEILAREWYQRGVPLSRIEQAILLGCIRKYVSWRNNPSQAPIATLRYFVPVLQELEGQQIGDDYWDYLRHRLSRMEKLWIQRHPPRTEDPRQDMGQL